MAEAIAFDLQKKSAHISSLNKTPATVIHEYSIKNHLVPKYDLIHNGVSHSKVSFKFRLKLEDYVAMGEGSSKKEARHVASLNLLKIMIEDKPQLLHTDFEHYDFDKHVVSPFENNIKVNAIGQLKDVCTNNKLGLPEFKLIREEGQDHAKLYTMGCQVAKLIETATHKTKKQAKHLAAIQMTNRIKTIDKSLVIEDVHHVSDSMKVLEQVEIIKSQQMKKTAPLDVDISNYHLLFKKNQWSHSDTLNTVINQYNKNNVLDLPEAYKVLCKVVTESEMLLVTRNIDPEPVDENSKELYILTIENVYPPIYGVGVGEDTYIAQQDAAIELLTAICILLI